MIHKHKRGKRLKMNETKSSNTTLACRNKEHVKTLKDNKEWLIKSTLKWSLQDRNRRDSEVKPIQQNHNACITKSHSDIFHNNSTHTLTTHAVQTEKFCPPYLSHQNNY